MKRIQYRGQKFKKRLTKEELKDLASDRFQQIGMDKHIQCNILSELCKNVESSKNPKFFSLISTPKTRNSASWIRAYSLIFKFLEEFKMTSTISTINKELKDHKIPFDYNFLKTDLPSQFLNNAIRSQRRNRKKFSTRVSTFKTSPPLINDENIDNNDDIFAISIQKKKNSVKNTVDKNNHDNIENEAVSYISGDDNSHFNDVSSIDALADDSFINND